jgi:hypothetical protein
MAEFLAVPPKWALASRGLGKRRAARLYKERWPQQLRRTQINLVWISAPLTGFMPWLPYTRRSLRDLVTVRSTATHTLIG